MRAVRPTTFALLAGIASLPAAGAEVTSAAPDAVAVTVYRAPYRLGSLELDSLRGFALITETRRVSLPAGDSTLRFEGVAGGIEAESAIVNGFPTGVIEKNRDARLLSPSLLVAASLHRPVELERTNPKTGAVERTRGTVESDHGGVVFRTPAGVEALRCSGLPESFRFEPFAGAQARPTLSVRVHSDAPLTRTVTLSYLAGGFDWSATYTAKLAPDGRTLDLGAWVTLANGNGESFADAQTQVVAGRLNREARDADVEEGAGPIVAECWPRGSTSDSVPQPRSPVAAPAPMMMRSLAMADGGLQEITVTGAKKVAQEDLGDLKLYRVPDRTTVAARQLKQVRLMDQFAVPVRQVHVVRVRGTGDDDDDVQVSAELRTRNSRANHLGLPLPAGDIALYNGDAAPLLLAQAAFEDHAVDQEVTFPLGESADLGAKVVTEERSIDSAHAKVVPLLPGVSLRSAAQVTSRRVEITSALPHAVSVEVQLYLDDGDTLVRADRALQRKNGRPTVMLAVPAQSRVVLRYATADTDDVLMRSP